MNLLIGNVLTATERERPELPKWCEDKRNELLDSGEMEALHWIVFELGFQRHDGVFNACHACSFFLGSTADFRTAF